MLPAMSSVFREQVAVVGTCAAELVSSASAASGQMERTTTELRQARDTISNQAKELAKIAPMKMSIKSLEDKVEFYEASEKR